MIYSENDLYKAFTLFQQGFDFYDVTNYFKKNNVSIYDKQKIELIIDAVCEHYSITEKEFVYFTTLAEISPKTAQYL